MPTTFETYQAMLQAFWDVKVTTESETQLVRVLTDHLIKTESIWASVRALSGHSRAISSLCDKGVLEQQNNQVRFSHQTVQEFAIARLFEEEGNLLSRYVWKHQGSIFARRTITAVLCQLRENNREKYHLEIEAIVSGKVRLHVLFLLIDFICRQQNPTSQEIEHIKRFLFDEERRLRVLIGISNRENWFLAFKETALPEIMRQPDIQQWPLISVLANAWKFDWNSTLKLIRDYWARDERFDNMTLSVMEHCATWNEEVLDLVQLVAIRVKAAYGYTYQHEKLIKVISSSLPEEGARLAARIISTDSPESKSSNHRYSPLEQSEDWYDLEAICNAAPSVFLKEIAPWLLTTIEKHHSGYSGAILAQYSGSCMALRDRKYARESTILTSIQTCIRLMSKFEPTEFVQLFRTYWNSENAVLHRLYIEGLMNVVDVAPENVLEYLLADNRRFSVGENGDTKNSQSVRLISLLFPHLNPGQQELLIQKIFNWTKYKEGVELIAEQIIWDRESRLHLLTAIPSKYVSPSLAVFIEGEKSQLPEWNRDIERSHFGWVKTIPPLTQDQMVTVGNDDLIIAFTKKTSRDNWNRVEGGFEEQGGGESAALELAKLAELNYERAGEIVRLLVDKSVVASVDLAIEGFANCANRQFFFSLLLEISPRCEERETFRYSASKVLLHFCDDEGLPEEMIVLLEGWLNLPWDHTRTVIVEGDRKEWESEISLLWTSLDSMILDTDHSYFTLVALTQSLLGRKEPQGNRWISDLSEHLDREVSYKTWTMFCDRLQYVRGNNCSPDLAKALIAKLFNKFPSLVSEPLGCRLLANLLSFVDSSFLSNIFRSVRTSEDPFEQQAVGELLTLSSLLDETSQWASPLLREEITKSKIESDSAFLAGCSHAAANLFHDLDKQSECTQILIVIISKGDSQAINATRQLFWNDIVLPSNDETAALIVAMTEQISGIGSSLAMEVLGQMSDILPSLRLEILNFCRRLIEVRFHELKRRDFKAYDVGPYLVEISMTLQRFADTRTEGLDLFEQLLRIGLDDADNALKNFDGNTGLNSQMPSIPRRRRRQQRRHKTD